MLKIKEVQRWREGFIKNLKSINSEWGVWYVITRINLLKLKKVLRCEGDVLKKFRIESMFVD